MAAAQSPDAAVLLGRQVRAEVVHHDGDAHIGRVEAAQEAAEARTLLGEAFSSPADLEVIGDALHVRINPLSAPRRSRAIAGLCEALNATEANFPGTTLRLVYSVKGY